MLYGSDAIGGVISIQTGGEGLSGAVEYGSFDTLRGHIGYSAEGERSNFGVALSGYQTDGVDTAGLNGETDGSDALSIIVQGGLALSADWKASGFATLRKSTQQSDPDTNFDGALDNANREGQVEQSIIGGSINGTTNGRIGTLSHILRASYSDVRSSNFAEDIFANKTNGRAGKIILQPVSRF